jgi:hypothetical protein
MSKLANLLILGWVASTAACSDDKARTELRCETATAVAPPINEEFNVQVGDSVIVDGGLQLQFVAANNESRCPSDVECISAGSVVIALRAQAYDREPRNFELETGADTSEIVEFDGGFYQIELGEVAPYPVSTQEIAADGYCAKFTVAKALE